MLRLVHCNGKSGKESLSRKLHLEKISLATFILGYDFLPLENELVNCFLSLVLLTPTRSTCFKIVSSFPLDCFSIGLVLVRLVAPLREKVFNINTIWFVFLIIIIIVITILMIIILMIILWLIILMIMIILSAITLASK